MSGSWPSPRRWRNDTALPRARRRRRRTRRHRLDPRGSRGDARDRGGERAAARTAHVPGAPRGRAGPERGRAQGAARRGPAGRRATGPGTQGQVAEEHGGEGGAAARGDTVHGVGRRYGEHGGGGVPLPRVLAEHRRPGAAALAAAAAEHTPRVGGVLLRAARRVGEGPAVHQTLGQLRVRLGGPGGGGGGGALQGVRAAAGRVGRARAVRAVLLQRETAVSARARVIVALAVAIPALARGLAAQDTAAVDRGVRIGIIYRPGVRPGLVVLPPQAGALDSVERILSRDLDYSDRFELITLPAGDSIRVATAAPAAPAPGTRPAAGKGTTGGAATAAALSSLNYPLYQALGADFAVLVRAAPPDTAVVTVHDVTAGGVRREFRAHLPPLKDPDFRMAVHRLADRVLEATLGVAGLAATRVLYVLDSKVYSIDQDGADARVVSASDRQALSPAWAPDGRRFAYMELGQGKGTLFIQDVAPGRSRPRRRVCPSPRLG